MIRHYYYDKQVQKYLKQFAAIFIGLSVQTGVGETGDKEMWEVPIRYGSVDRVAAAIANANTQNKMISLPLASCYMLSLEPAPERRKAPGFIERKTILPVGGVFPDDLKVRERMMPVPYTIAMEVSLYASNTDQMLQMLEQILIIFDYDLQIQSTDNPDDWTKLTTVSLESITNEENYPIGVDRRVIVWTLTFSLPIWISLPKDIKDNVVTKVIQQIGDLDGFHLNQYDENGELVAFDNLFGTSVSDPLI